MISKKFLNILLLLVLFCSFFSFSVDAAPIQDTTSINLASETTELSQAVFDPEPPHQINPFSILVYTEFADVTTGIHGEWNNTMWAISNSYGTDYYYTNLTDYNDLAAELPNHDILLIPEQEKSNSTMSNTIGAAWASTLTDFVTNGGIVILMDWYTSSGGGEFGMTSHIYNASGVMQIISFKDVTSTNVFLVGCPVRGLLWRDRWLSVPLMARVS